MKATDFPTIQRLESAIIRLAKLASRDLPKTQRTDFIQDIEKESFKRALTIEDRNILLQENATRVSSCLPGMQLMQMARFIIKHTA